MNGSVRVAAGQHATAAEAMAILVDSQGNPVNLSAEALRVLLYPSAVPENGKARRVAAERLRSLFPTGLVSPETPAEGEFLSGRRRYSYRVYRLENRFHRADTPTVMILLERNPPVFALNSASLTSYRLTVREDQVVRLLVQGLSNKQIAAELGISPNTVKVFVRLIMTKMGVSNRFGILGKLLSRPSPAAWPASRALGHRKTSLDPRGVGPVLGQGVSVVGQGGQR